ncbi:hypothetical protein ACTXG5_27315 [Mycobacterium sp. Dal123C01]|uniref:hypothetical protein n=1 Tax=Mycobacterium sp. Dal123C01 TaxID=3457577 RepID=UPI00403E5D7B
MRAVDDLARRVMTAQGNEVAQSPLREGERTPMVLSVVPDVLMGSAAGNTVACAVSVASSADCAAMLGVAAAVLGLIGASYLWAYAPAQPTNLAPTALVGRVHEGIAAETQAPASSFVAVGDS